MTVIATQEQDSSQGDKGPTLIIVSSLFTSIAFVTTVLRLWVRQKRRALRSDDYTMAAAMILTIVEAALTIQAVTRGKGKRTKFLSQDDVDYINMFSWIAQIVLFPAMALVKISVCLLMTRIDSSQRLKWLTSTIIVLLSVASFELVFILLAQCRPIDASWKPRSGNCWPVEVRIYSIYFQAGKYAQNLSLSTANSATGCSIITDLVCSLLPTAIIWKLQLPLHRKASICCLMALGLVYVSLPRKLEHSERNQKVYGMLCGQSKVSEPEVKRHCL